MTSCGAALVTIRPVGGFPKQSLLESVKKWQCSFFYVKNADPASDYVNLPPFANVALVERHN